MKSFIFSIAFLLFASLNSASFASHDKTATHATPEMELSLSCDSDEISFTFFSAEKGIIEKNIEKAIANAQNHEVVVELVSEEDGIVFKKNSQDSFHETIDFQTLKKGSYILLIEYRGNILEKEFTIE